MYGLVNEVLIQLSLLEKALAKWVEWGLGTIAGSSSQFDGEDGMSSSHSKEGPRARVVEYEAHILGLALVVVRISYGHHDAESSIGLILHKWWSGVGEAQ